MVLSVLSVAACMSAPVLAGAAGQGGGFSVQLPMPDAACAALHAKHQCMYVLELCIMYMKPAPDPVQDLAEQAARSQNSSDEMTNTSLTTTSLTSLSNGLTVSAAASAVAAPAGAAAAASGQGASTPADAAGGSRWGLGQAARNLQDGFAAQVDAATTPFYTPVNRSRTGDTANE